VSCAKLAEPIDMSKGWGHFKGEIPFEIWTRVASRKQCAPHLMVGCTLAPPGEYY